MNIWLQNSIKNLLPLSEEKENFKEALKEWFFTGEILDHEQPIETCELCEKDEVRYQFEIANNLNNKLLVGSKCIEKFDITIIDEFGKEVTEHKELYLQKQAKRKHILNVFSKLLLTNSLAKVKGHTKISLDKYCYSKYQNEKKLTPKILNYLFQRLDEEGIKYEKRHFTISLKSYEVKDQLIALLPNQYERIKSSLSAQQRKFYELNKKTK